MSTRKQVDTRDYIIHAADSLFYRRGYAHTSFSDLVDETGVQRGNIYHYFKTKDDILDAVIEQRLTRYRHTLAHWDETIDKPVRRIRKFITMVASNREQLSSYGCPIGTLNSELGKDDFALRETARKLFDVFLDWLEIQFRALGKPKQARTRAMHLLARAEGISLMAHVYQDPEFVETETRALGRWLKEVQSA